MKRNTLLKGATALVLSTIMLTGCGNLDDKNRNLGLNATSDDQRQVVYTKHGRISGQAMSFSLNNGDIKRKYSQGDYPNQYSYGTRYANPTHYGNYWPRSANQEQNRNTVDVPNYTNNDNTNNTNNPNNNNANEGNNNTTTQNNNQQATPKQPSTSNKTNDSTLQQVVDLVNQERQKQGLPALKIDNTLMNVAQKKADDMLNNNYFSHTSPTYGSPFDMMKQFGVDYSNAGENIAQGQTSAQKVMNDWMNSPGHRANILNKNFTYIGVGHTDSKNYWVQEFIKK